MEKQTHKARTRQRILEEAARVMREKGTESIGVASLMKRVGLTHGGFYAHFSSRDDLVQEVMKQMFADSAQRVEPAAQDAPPAQRLVAFINYYLSVVHRNAPAEGCPLPALVSEVAHLPEEARQIFSQGMHSVYERLAKPLREMGHDQPEALASSMLAEMVGALALARACPDDQLADEMLACSRYALMTRAGLES